MARKDATKSSDSSNESQPSATVKKPSKTQATERPDETSMLSCTRVVKRLWNILKYVLLSLLIPPFLNYASLNREVEHLKGDGLLYDIGHGQMLYMRCEGTGWPTVILDAPTGSNSDVWAIVQGQLAKTTKVCVYDRAGLGMSSTPLKQNKSAVDIDRMKSYNRWEEFTVERMVDDVHSLLSQASDQKKPFIYVGSELGATIGRFYAQLYDSEISDLVLVDPLVENLFAQDENIWENFWYNQMIPSIQSLQFSAAIGLTRLLLIGGLMDIPLNDVNVEEEILARQKYLLCNPRHLSASVDEHHFMNATFSQMRMLWRVKQFPSNISVTIVNGNYYNEHLPSELNKAWAKSQEHLISTVHPQSHHIVVNGADHTMIYKHPNAIIDSVRKIVRDRRYEKRHYDTENSENIENSENSENIENTENSDEQEL